MLALVNSKPWETYPGEWVIIGTEGAPPYEEGYGNVNEGMGLRYRFVDESTIHVVGTVTGSINGGSVVFYFPKEIQERIKQNQNSPANVRLLNGTVSNVDARSIVYTSGAFVAYENCSTSVGNLHVVNHTIILDL